MFHDWLDRKLLKRKFDIKIEGLSYFIITQLIPLLLGWPSEKTTGASGESFPTLVTRNWIALIKAGGYLNSQRKALSKKM